MRICDNGNQKWNKDTGSDNTRQKTEASRIDWAENILTVIVVEQTRRVIECVQNIVEEALRIRVVEGDSAEDIFSYMSAGEMMNATLINIGIGNRVQDAYNSRQQYEFVSLRRLHDCINMVQIEIM